LVPCRTSMTASRARSWRSAPSAITPGFIHASMPSSPTAGPDMKSPPLFTTRLRRWRQSSQAVTGAVCLRVCPGPRIRQPGRTRADPSHTKKPPSRTTCPILGPNRLTLVGKSRRKRAGNVLDTPRHTCYSKTVGKRFPITLSPYHLSPHLKGALVRASCNPSSGTPRRLKAVPGPASPHPFFHRAAGIPPWFAPNPRSCEPTSCEYCPGFSCFQQPGRRPG